MGYICPGGHVFQTVVRYGLEMQETRKDLIGVMWNNGRRHI